MITSASATTAAERTPVVLDVLGLELRPGDRVWLVTETRDGLERVGAGRVARVEDGSVTWTADDGAIHISSPAALKVVARARRLAW